MSGIPLPALDLQLPSPRDPLDEFSRAAALKGQLQQQAATQQAMQGQQLDIESKQLALESQRAIQKAYVEANGNPDQTIKLAAKYGANPKDLIGLQTTFLDQKTKTLDLVQKQGAEAKRQADLMQGAHDAVDSSQDKPTEYAKQRVGLQQQGVDVSPLPPQYPGDDAFKLIGAVVHGHTQQVEDAFKESERQKNLGQAASANAEADIHKQEAAFYQRGGGGIAPRVPVETASLMDYMRMPQAQGEPMHTPANYPAWKAKQTSEAEAPVRIATAKAEGAARADVAAAVARGSNAALAQVPPHLVAPATAAAEKAGSEYAQAHSVSQRLQAMMDAAKSGNVVSYQLLPEEGALQVVTNQGIHRINMAEIQNYGGGSAWQRLEGHLGKALTGASIPASVLGDMADVQKIMAEGSQTKYENTLKTINQNYGSQFKPVQMDDMARNKTAGGLTLKAPNGKTYNFKDQAALDAFKKEAGIQ